MPNLEAIREGMQLPPLSKGPVIRQNLVEWCAAENDYYPLHYDERVAAAMKLPGTPIQGTFQYALMAQLVQRWLGGDGTLERISARYRAMAIEGETIKACATVTQVERDAGRAVLDVWVENSKGERCAGGEAVVTFKAP